MAILMTDKVEGKGDIILKEYIAQKIDALDFDAEFVLSDLIKEKLDDESMSFLGIAFHEMVSQGEFQCKEITKDSDTVKRYKKTHAKSPFSHPNII